MLMKKKRKSEEEKEPVITQPPPQQPIHSPQEIQQTLNEALPLAPKQIPTQPQQQILPQTAQLTQAPSAQIVYAEQQQLISEADDRRRQKNRET